ncbi:MAG: tRNA (N6-threonylcarbamoyladenosine(37)-N6)-methyltransferase TrmO [Lentisphaeria bacterium]|nr:tRNA (N6-threonylcarbamoyladenosine(37)-N6)-methyltransferase TrmO [Lentisphaeria bacterium]
MVIHFVPIGLFRCDRRYAYDAARQGALAADSTGTVELAAGRNFDQALQDLAGFERIWLIYWFHHNENWKPLVRPPRGARKVGVFASRAPYRPNPLGLSCVRLAGIEGTRLFVTEHDLLDGTPILDIKPYLPYADSFPEARAGWVDELAEPEFAVAFAPLAEAQLGWLEEQSLTALRPFLAAQLASRPTDASRKRLRPLGPGRWEIAYRTWRAEFTLAEASVQIEILRSGYGQADLDAAADRYGDKPLHRAFLLRFPAGGNGDRG